MTINVDAKDPGKKCREVILRANSVYTVIDALCKALRDLFPEVQKKSLVPVTVDTSMPIYVLSASNDEVFYGINGLKYKDFFGPGFYTYIPNEVNSIYKLLTTESNGPGDFPKYVTLSEVKNHKNVYTIKNLNKGDLYAAPHFGHSSSYKENTDFPLDTTQDTVATPARPKVLSCDESVLVFHPDIPALDDTVNRLKAAFNNGKKEERIVDFCKDALTNIARLEWACQKMEEYRAKKDVLQKRIELILPIINGKLRWDPNMNSGEIYELVTLAMHKNSDEKHWKTVLVLEEQAKKFVDAEKERKGHHQKCEKHLKDIARHFKTDRDVKAWRRTKEGSEAFDLIQKGLLAVRLRVSNFIEEAKIEEVLRFEFVRSGEVKNYLNSADMTISFDDAAKY